MLALRNTRTRNFILTALAPNGNSSRDDRFMLSREHAFQHNYSRGAKVWKMAENINAKLNGMLLCYSVAFVLEIGLE